jgi:hypothetical protein
MYLSLHEIEVFALTTFEFAVCVAKYCASLKFPALATLDVTWRRRLVLREEIVEVIED